MEQAELLRHAVEVLERQDLVYMLVGSIASMVYGEPRSTRDIDIVVDLRPDQVAGLCKAFPEEEYYVSNAAALQAATQGGQFNVIHPASGNKIDFVIARKDAWGQSQLQRRRQEPILPGRMGYTAAPEDVILGKLWYYQEGESEKHLRDIASMLEACGSEIDLNYIEHWARQLGLTGVWQAVIERRQG